MAECFHALGTLPVFVFLLLSRHAALLGARGEQVAKELRSVGIQKLMVTMANKHERHEL